MHSFKDQKKQHPFFSKFYLIYNQERKKLKPLAEYAHYFSLNQAHQYNMKQNKQRLYMSNLEFKPIHNFFVKRPRQLNTKKLQTQK